MQCFSNSWCVRNLLVMVLRLNQSLKYHELIPTQDCPGPAPTVVTFYSEYSTPHMSSTMPEKTAFRFPECWCQKMSTSDAGDLNISNYTILNTFSRIGLFAAHPDAWKPLCVVNSMQTKIQSKTWTCFPTSNVLKTSQTRSLYHRHLRYCRRNHSPVLALCWSFTLLSHGNTTLRAAFRWTYKTIPTTRLWCVKSTNMSSVGSRRRAWRHTMTTCWRKKPPLCVSNTSNTGMVSRSSWLACLMSRLSRSGNYTLLRKWDGMTITYTLSNAGVETSFKAWYGCCGSQPTPSISFSPNSGASRTIHHRNASMPKCTQRTGGGRHRSGEIFEDNYVLIDV